MSVRALDASEKRTLALLGLPTAALALSITVVTAYVPVAASEFLDSSVVIGGFIAIEGVLALWLPLVVGSWSDRLRTARSEGGCRSSWWQRRSPAVSLVLVGVAGTLALMKVIEAVAVFFVAYFIAYEPYRALYPDLIDDEIAARAQSTQAIWRGLGTGTALIGGGLLIAWGTAAPFVGSGDPLHRRDGRLPAPSRSRAPAARRHSRASEGGDGHGGGKLAGRHPARPPRVARVPRRQRALGSLARRAQDVRLPLHHDRADPQPVRGGGHRRRRRAARPPRRRHQRQARRSVRPAARDGVGAARSTGSGSSCRRSPSRSRSSSRS